MKLFLDGESQGGGYCVRAETAAVQTTTGGVRGWLSGRSRQGVVTVFSAPRRDEDGCEGDGDSPEIDQDRVEACGLHSRASWDAC